MNSSDLAPQRTSTDAPPPSRTLFEGAYQDLRADILACRLRPGSKLQINLMAVERSISISGIREALSRLSAEGLVISEPQRGFRVAPVSREDLDDLTRTRMDIEALCLSRSIEQGGVDWETAVVAALHRLSRTPYWAGANDRRLSDEWATAHHAFHDALVGANGSLHLTRFRSSLYQRSERYRRLSVPVFPKIRDVETEHHEMAEAALKRQTARACELVSEHILLTMKIIVEGLALISE